jgi:hypothetical protein
MLLHSLWEGGEKMSFLTLLELASKIITIACGVVTFCVATGKIIKARNGKRKRNASNDVPK